MPEDAVLIADHYPEKTLDGSPKNIQEQDMNDSFDPPLDRVTPSIF